MSQRLLVTRDSGSIFASVGGAQISVGEFLADVSACAESLPKQRYLVNLCAQRYAFSVAFFAAALRGQTNLLPTKRSNSSWPDLRREFGDIAVLSDDPNADADHRVNVAPGHNGSVASPSLEPDAVVAVAFTSGSTGTPQPHPKPWRLLSHGREMHARYLPGSSGALRGLVATVPSWHMYGLEWALLLPTTAELSLYCGNDFFPGDVVRALDSYRCPSVLVSTPVHLKAMLKTPAPEQNVNVTVCATAPLSSSLAEEVETHLQTQLFEIYGCSELGSLASRQPVQEPFWSFFPEFELQLEADRLSVAIEHLPDRVLLTDRFAAARNGRYELLGRSGDMVKVAGKRESLAHLNSLLTSIAGVDDGVFFQPEQLGLPNTGRLGAIVVAPALDDAALKTALSTQLDPAFLPRPIHRVSVLPRDRTSKLPQETLRKLIARASASTDDG